MNVRSVTEVPRAVFGEFGRIDLPVGGTVELPDAFAKELIDQGIVEQVEDKS